MAKSKKTTKTTAKEKDQKTAPSKINNLATKPPQFLFGYADKNGKIMIPAKFESAIKFSEGQAAVLQNQVWSAIDTNGNIRFDFDADLVRSKKSSLFMFRKDQKWGLCNSEGKKSCDAIYSSILSYCSKAIVAKDEQQVISLFDFDGNVLISDIEEASDWSGNLICLLVEKGYGIANAQGNWVVKPQAKRIYPFSEGLATFETEKGKFGYLNEKGEIQIPASFDLAFDFSDGLARVKVKNKFGYIDKKGQLVIQPRYDDLPRMAFDDCEPLTRFRNGTAMAGLGDDIIQIDKKEKTVKSDFSISDLPVMLKQLSKIELELNVFREVNPAWEQAQEAQELGSDFVKSIKTYEEKFDEALLKDEKLITNNFKKILTTKWPKDMKGLLIEVFDIENYELICGAIDLKSNLESLSKGISISIKSLDSVQKKYFEKIPEPKSKKEIDELQNLESRLQNKVTKKMCDYWQKAKKGDSAELDVYLHFTDTENYTDLNSNKSGNFDDLLRSMK